MFALNVSTQQHLNLTLGQQVSQADRQRDAERSTVPARRPSLFEGGDIQLTAY